MTTQHGIRRIAKIAVCAAAAVSMMLPLAACGKNGGQNAGGGDSSIINVFNGATGTITENFNPFSPTALQPTLGLIYEPLFYYNIYTGADPKPMLGESWEWNEDGSQLTVITREGVKWQDGEPFTAKDVAYTFQLIVDNPALNTSGTPIKSAEATDDTHAVITFNAPNSYLQESQILGNSAIVPEHLWSKVEDPSAYTNEDPIGTGPFKLDNFTSQAYTLTANADYWNGKPKIEGARFLSLNDADGAASALIGGQIDWMSSFIPGLDNLLKDNPDISYTNTPYMTTAIITCANGDAGCVGPQTDPAVRQAMYYAMDRTQLNKLAADGTGKIGSPTMLVPDRDEKWIPDESLRTTPEGSDIDKANEILDEAGWTMGDDGIRVKDGERLSMTIQTVSGYSDYITINNTLQQTFKEVGIELKPTLLSWNEWNNNEQTGQFQLSLDSLGAGSSTDPYFIYNKFISENAAKVGETGGVNLSRYSNPVVDEAVAAAASTNDEAEKIKQYGIVEAELAKDMPYITIYLNTCLNEYNQTKYTGWPTEDDMYALPITWRAWDNGIILQTIEPKQ